MPRIKICCISSPAEARLAVAAGASALGLVSAMPSGPGVIDDALIAAISAGVPPAIGTFLLTSETQSDAIIRQQRFCRTNTLQLVDHTTGQVRSQLRRALPGISIVQVVHVRNESAIDEALAYAEAVDALLLDSGNPALTVKELGGTGRTHDWAISRRIVEQASVPVFLAGGLNPKNVARAIDVVHPYGIDVCSGVRTEGRLDAAKLAALLEAAGN